MGRIDQAARALDSPPLRSLVRTVPLWRGVLVLNYHRIHSDGVVATDEGVLSATSDDLDQQLSWLKRAADIISLPELEDVLGRRGRHVVVTFDDGYRDNHELALPVLRAHGVPAAFFIATGYLDDPRLAWWDELAWMVSHATSAHLPSGPWLAEPLELTARRRAVGVLTGVYKQLDGGRGESFLDWCGEETGAGRAPRGEGAQLWMTWDMVRDLRDSGMTLGGHTVTHPVLARLGREEQRREVGESLERLESELGERPDSFSYPVGLPGAYDAETKEILREEGVRLAFSFHGGYQRRLPFDPLDVPRASVTLGMGGARFRSLVALPRWFARW